MSPVGARLFRTPQVAAQVRDLLDADEEPGAVHSGGLAPLLEGAEVHLEPGKSVGPYRVLETIGVGGMGTVYLARQDEPVRRRVALKVLDLRLDHSEAQQRFSAERHAMGRLDHPNVAKILDAGTTGDGTPYLAMELIDGEPIVTYCDRRALSIEQRLSLFMDVCRGVDHAHQKFLLHRDIKPSNILVTEVDGRAMPKLIDFGVVKGLDGSLVEDVALTGHRVIGTPLYMSPEALGLDDLPLDTRSDVFSLGVLLYELLAGQTPWGNAGEGLAQLIERRLEGEPAAPSTRLQTLPVAERRRLGERRGAPTTTWFHRLRGDLDAIVNMAISRRPQDRYDSARSLAADVERHLQHRPIFARRPLRFYLFRKSLRRHRAAFVLILALVLGTLGTGLGLLEAQRQAREAIASRDESDQISELMVSLLRNAAPGEPEAGLSAQELLARGRELIKSERGSHLLRRSRFQEILGRIYLDWHLDDEAEPLLEAALEASSGPAAPRGASIHPLLGLASLRSRQERYEEAKELAERALARLGSESSEDSAFGNRQLDLARAHLSLGRIFNGQGELESAELHLQQARNHHEKAPERNPTTAGLVLSTLSNVHCRRREFAEAARYSGRGTRGGPTDRRIREAGREQGRRGGRQPRGI